MRTLMLAAVLVTPVMAKDERVYALRIQRASSDKNVPVLVEYLKNHILAPEAKLGVETIACFVPIDNPENRVITLQAYKSEKDRQQLGSISKEDVDARLAFKKAHPNFFFETAGSFPVLTSTDFSPNAFKPGSGDRVFELRTYVTPPKKLDALHSRFRDHTLKLFEKHGMTNIAYFKFNTVDDLNFVRYAAPGSDKSGTDFPKITTDTGLIYLLAHKDQAAAKASFDAFRKDPAWVAAKGDSEKDGSLTVKDGVISLFLKPADWSPLK